MESCFVTWAVLILCCLACRIICGVTFSIIKKLNNTFITPIEREDALEIAVHMDEILDGLEECAAHFYMFNIYEIDGYMVEYSDLLNKCIVEI